jgi:hypothetical protein
MHSQTLFRLNPIDRSNCSSVSSAVRLNPSSIVAALFTAKSSRPNRSTVRATRASTCAALETSVATNSAGAPRASISRAAASPRSAPRAAITTDAPRLANANAVARPIPELPPVTSATFPRISISQAYADVGQASRPARAPPRPAASRAVLPFPLAP